MARGGSGGRAPPMTGGRRRQRARGRAGVVPASRGAPLFPRGLPRPPTARPCHATRGAASRAPQRCPPVGRSAPLCPPLFTSCRGQTVIIAVRGGGGRHRGRGWRRGRVVPVRDVGGRVCGVGGGGGGAGGRWRTEVACDVAGGSSPHRGRRGRGGRLGSRGEGDGGACPVPSSAASPARPRRVRSCPPRRAPGGLHPATVGGSPSAKRPGPLSSLSVPPLCFHGEGGGGERPTRSGAAAILPRARAPAARPDAGGPGA